MTLSVSERLGEGFPRSFHVVNLGCKVNKVESDAIAAAMLRAGAVPADQENADVIFVNTCTVTGEADKKARKAVRHALGANPDARVVVTGCGVAIDPDVYASLGEQVEVVPRMELAVRLGGGASGPVRLGEGFRTRVSLKVQDGCDHACTYCIVHVARGRAVSVPFSDAVDESRVYLRRGVKELVLTGIDLASYRDGGKRLAHLAEALVEEADRACLPGERPARIRVSSTEPQTLDEEFVDLLAAGEGRVCRHLHLPLQSGSSRVLREMARPYDADRFAEIVDHLRERVPSVALTTDVIVGFPGETDADFQSTLELVKRCRFSKIHVFPYSRRNGTPAAARSDQIAPEVKAARAAELRNLGDQLRKEDFARRRGTEELVLVEDDCALTESYYEVPVPDGASIGMLVPAVLS